MKFETLGKEGHPAILIFPGMLCSSKSMMPIAERLSRQYDVILAVYDGYDSTGFVYHHAQEEAERTLQWLKEHDISSLAMAHGTSMGAEVLMAFVQLAQQQNYEVKHCFFDGGPFFRFSSLRRKIMYTVFRMIAGKVKGHDNEAGVQKFLHSRKMQNVPDKEAYHDMIADMFHNAQNVKPESLKAMTETCYHFTFEQLPEQTQKKCTFLWGENESARKSEQDIRKAYPHASVIIKEEYRHCGYQVLDPDDYVRMLMSIMKNMIRKIQDTDYHSK